MYSIVHKQVQKISDIRKQRSQTISLADTVLSASAMFALKFPSMLNFVTETKSLSTRHNLKTLFKIHEIPSDTTMRRTLDSVSTTSLQSLFKPILSEMQRGKILETFTFLKEGYLLSIDGTGSFSSHEVHCKNCCVKKHRDGSRTYYHQLVGGSFVHPHKKFVIPIAPEPISQIDGNSKNDCERNASARLLRRFRREHPHLKVVVVEDGLSSNAPHIELLKELKFRYILGCKPGDHRSLFNFIEGSESLQAVQYDTVHEEGVQHKFRYMNHVSLNDSNPDCLVNFIEYWEVKGDKTQHFSWVTDIEITEHNLMEIMRGGRSRWRIENETFNTLKNLGYNFEHNFGHGNQNLSNNLAVIMMLVFLIDQLQQVSCKLFRKAKEKSKRITYLWERMRNYFMMFEFRDWDEFLRALAFGIETNSCTINTE